MNIPPLVLPTGWSAMGSPAPDFIPSADGSAFYGVQAKLNGGNYVFSVWWQKPGQVAQRVDSGTSGQGQLRGAGGPLWVCRYPAPGDGQLPVVIEIPQYVPFPLTTSDPRVDALVSQIAAMEQEIAALRATVANVEVGDYPAIDRELIRRLRAFLLPLLGP